MKNYLLSIFFISMLCTANSQTIWNFQESFGCISGYDKCWTALDESYVEFPLFYIRDTSLFHIESDTCRIQGLSEWSDSIPSSFIWADENGVLRKSPLDSLHIPFDPSDTLKTRSLNSSFIVNSDKRSFVSYTIGITANLTLTSGQTGTVFLEVSPNGADWDEIGRISNGNTGTLAVGLNISQAVTSQLSGYVPAGYYVRLRTSGNASIVYINGNETHF